jgi:hypothetical protein
MDAPAAMIGVVQGAPSTTVQSLFRALVERWRPDIQIAGVIAEGHGLAERACNAGFLRNVATGEQYSIFQDLGPGSTSCHLEGAAALAAGEAVQRTIVAGCQLVVLSKFGKLEAAGMGLAGAFEAAFEAQVALLTSVSPAHEQAWKKFAPPLFIILAASFDEVDAWMRPGR